MKKRIIAICLVLMLLIGGTAFADDRQDAYIDITLKYQAAFPEDNFDFNNALSLMELIVKRYDEENENDRMKEYSNAEAYYRYAKGMLAFDQGDYPTVIDNMTELTIQGENVIADYAPASYLAFAWGMQYLKEKDYDNAYIELGSISSGALASKHYYQRFKNAMIECKQGIKETHLKKAENLLKRGEYDKAEEECDAVEAVLHNDKETKEMREKIEKAAGGKEQTEHSIKITSAKAKGPDSIMLEWEGDQETYNVSWTADLAHGENAKTEKVNGHTLTITGLYPGTRYQFTVECEGYKDRTSAKTKDADSYQVDDGDGNMVDIWGDTSGSSLYDYATRDEFLETNETVFEYIKIKDWKAQPTGDYTIHLSQRKLEEHVLFFMFVPNRLTEDFAGKEYVLLLHIDGVDTIAHSGQMGDEYVRCKYGRAARLCIVMHDWLDLLAEKNEDGELIGKEYTLDLLVEGLLVCSMTGALE